MNGDTNSDLEMTEADAASTAAEAAASTPDDVVRGLITLARQLVDEGKPSQALQAVVMAMKTTGGETAVFQILQQARELYRSKLQTSADADQLASLFAQCAIAEAQPASRTVPPLSASPSSVISAPGVVPDVYGASILAETGRRQIVLDAFADGSSFICLQCGGLVSVNRRDEHYAYWCQL